MFRRPFAGRQITITVSSVLALAGSIGLSALGHSSRPSPGSAGQGGLDRAVQRQGSRWLDTEDQGLRSRREFWQHVSCGRRRLEGLVRSVFQVRHQVRPPLLQDPVFTLQLHIEYRFVGEQCPGGPSWALRNSGVMIHGQTPESMGKDQEFPVSIEVQFLGGNGKDKRPTCNVCTPGTNIVMKDRLITQHCTNSHSKTYPRR